MRGHSNVQGNRACGIDHRPTEEFLDRLAGTCGIDPSRGHGLDTVRTIRAVRDGEVKVSVGMKRPASPRLLSEPAIVAGMARAALPDSQTPWDWYIEDHDRIRDTMAEALEGFRLPLGFRIKQPARELVSLTLSGRAEFSAAPLPDVVPEPGTLAPGTMRSHDQWNTTICSDNDRYRGIKNLRTLIFMNRAGMRERGIADMGPGDITSTAAADGS